MKKARIFLGLADHGCRLYALSLGLRAQGYQALYLGFFPEPNGADAYRSPREVPFLWRIHLALGQARSSSGTSFVVRRICGLLQELMRFPLFLWALFSFDVFIFGPFNSFFSQLLPRFDTPLWIFQAELLIYRLLRKKLIFTFSGGDSRPAYIDGTYIHGEDWPIGRVRRHVRWQRRRIRQINRFAHELVDIPPQGQYLHTRRFVLHTKVGMPVLPSDLADSQPVRHGDTVRILHTPSDPLRKGTVHVEQLVRELQADNYQVEYQTATKIPRKSVMQMMQETDIFFDEAYSDFPASCTTVEAACNGAAVISCGASAEFWQRQEPEVCAVFGHMREAEILPYVRQLLADRELLAKKKEAGRRFLEREWNLDQVTRRYICLIEGQAPPSWYFDPLAADQLLGGFFMPPDKARAFLRSYIERYGSSALEIDDKPSLRAALEAFARGEG